MGTKIHPTSEVSPQAHLEDGVEIGPYCCVGEGVVLGEGCRLRSHVVISGNTRIGTGGDIYPFAVIGETGPNWQPTNMVNTGLKIGSYAVIREMVTIHGGTAARGTCVGDHVLLMAGSHISHDCIIGDHVILANYVQLAGHCELGDCVGIGGLSAFHQFVRIGKYAFVGGMSATNMDIMPFSLSRGVPCLFRTVNKVGLRRRGYSRERILTIRKAYKELFGKGVVLEEGLENLARNYKGNEDVEHIVAFARESKGLSVPDHGI